MSNQSKAGADEVLVLVTVQPGRSVDHDQVTYREGATFAVSPDQFVRLEKRGDVDVAEEDAIPEAAAVQAVAAARNRRTKK